MRKLTDTKSSIGEGGRFDRYWKYRSVKPHSWSGKTDVNVDINDLVSTYRIKGFEFGNWLNNNERYDRLLACRDSLEHLSFIMKSNNLGMDYLIGIAFGARGRKGAKAHFESYYDMINMTKMKGDNSLAHEYGHAIDYNIGNFVSQLKFNAYLSGGHSTSDEISENMNGDTIRRQMEKLMRMIYDTESFKNSYKRKKDKYWHNRTEVFARTFEQFVCYELRLKGIRDRYLTKDWEYYTTAVHYLAEKDFKLILPEMKKLISMISMKMNAKTSSVGPKTNKPAKKIAASNNRKKQLELF